MLIKPTETSMDAEPASSPANGPSPALACVEHGVWAAIPAKPPGNSHRLRLKDVFQEESRTVKKRGVMTFHAVGCTGDFKDHTPGKKVAAAMAAQISKANVYGGFSEAVSASFLLHLGDIAYTSEDAMDPEGKDQQEMYNSQFYAQYADYSRNIFAIAGNHDSKYSSHEQKSGIDHFLKNFCASARSISPDNKTDKRPTMIQPYPYWLLETPVAYIVALDTNDINGGQLDDPVSNKTPQYDWLVSVLKRIKKEKDDKAVLLALHYPPYSGARDFRERGDPNLGPTPRKSPPTPPLEPLGIILRKAFRESGQYPDLVLSAHAHLYQRITYTGSDGRQTPYLIVGNGGHGPVEKISTSCAGELLPRPQPPFKVVLPKGLALPKGDSAKVVAYVDDDFGFLRLTIQEKTIVGEFFSAYSESQPDRSIPTVADSFTLKRRKHLVVGTANVSERR
jgi:acid phosphatase type 7